jgi:hypothetical protein
MRSRATAYNGHVTIDPGAVVFAVVVVVAIEFWWHARSR